MNQYDLNAFHSEFDPAIMVESFRQDSSLQNKAKQFALLKTAYFLVFSRGDGQVSALNNSKKETLLAAFTCREELEKWTFDRQEVIELPFEALRQMVANSSKVDGIVINPFGKALSLRRSHLADMESTLRAAVPRTGLQLTATLDYPIGLPMAVQELMRNHPEVYRVWLMAARAPDEHTDHKLLIVDFDGEKEPLFPLLAKAVRLYMRQGETFEMAKADLKLLRIAEAAARPIYEKQPSMKPEE